MDCIFCDILSGKRNAHPIDVGHTLVIPKQHHLLITDMDHESVGQLFSLIPRIANAVLKATHADAFSLGQNNGKAAKQIIPHVHVHIIPRYSYKGTVWTKRGIVEDSVLSELARRIRGHLDLL